MARVLLDLTVLASASRHWGVGRYVADLARGLAALPDTPGLELVGIEQLPWLGPARLSDDLRGAVARLTAADVPTRSHVAWAYRFRVGAARAALSAHADLLHNGHPEATPAGPLPCARVVTCHDLIPLTMPEQYLSWRDGYRAGRRRLDARRYGSAAHVIAVSRATADDLMRMFDIAADRITVVHNGVDLSRWDPEPNADDDEVLAQHGLERGRYLLYVGGSDWRKNMVGMVAALARVRRAAGLADVKLVWAGNMGPERRAQLAVAAGTRGLSDAIHTLGYVADRELGALYRGALCHLLVSRMEGFGYPVVEAMACGCPVVTSNVSSTAEIAADSALTVGPEDHDAIADAIITLANDAAARRQLIAAGLERARSFSVAHMACGTLQVYQQLV